MKELKAWLDAEMNYVLEASVDCVTDRERGYAAGRIKSLQRVEEFICQQEESVSNLDPTEAEWEQYAINKITGIRMYRDRTHIGLREAAQAFGFQASF